MQQKYIIAIIYTIALFLDRLDITIVNTTLPTIATIFGVSITATDAISLAFLIALALAIPVSCWLGDRFGHKNVFIAATLVFGLGSLLCFLANSLWTLTLLRFVQGLGGGVLIPVGMTLVYQLFDRSEYASITSFTFIPSLIAPAIAPYLGGVLLEEFGWRFVYVFSGPICLFLAGFAFLFLNVPSHKIIKSFDWLGFIYISAILIILFYMLSIISKTGFAWIDLYLATGLIILINAFISREKKASSPLFDLSYFQNDIFVKANFIQLCFQICHYGSLFLIGIYLQVGLAMTATTAGLVIGMQALGAMTSSRFSVRLYNRYNAKMPITLGFLGLALLSPSILLIHAPELTWIWLMLFYFRGASIGLCGAPVQTLSVIAFPVEQMGPIHSIFNASRQIAISLGVALSSVVLAFGLKYEGLKDGQDITLYHAYDAFKLGFILIAVIALIGIWITHRIVFQEEEPLMTD